jgi:hypothetical protein
LKHGDLSNRSEARIGFNISLFLKPTTPQSEDWRKIAKRILNFRGPQTQDEWDIDLSNVRQLNSMWNRFSFPVDLIAIGPEYHKESLEEFLEYALICHNHLYCFDNEIQVRDFIGANHYNYYVDDDPTRNSIIYGRCKTIPFVDFMRLL